MGLIGPNGVVGIVTDVTKNFSIAMSVLHKDVSISAKLSDNEYFGHSKWDGKSIKHTKLQDVPWHVEPKIGSSVVTSGFSSFFPPGIPVGIVEGFRVLEGTNFIEIDLKLATNFSNLQFVYIASPDQAVELQKLDKGIND